MEADPAWILCVMFLVGFGAAARAILCFRRDGSLVLTVTPAGSLDFIQLMGVGRGARVALVPLGIQASLKIVYRCYWSNILT